MAEKKKKLSVSIPDRPITKRVEGGVTVYDVLNLGAGTQSTLQYLIESLIFRGEIERLKSILEPEEFAYFMGLPRLSCAVFADTGDEPKSVYDHLNWMRSLDGPPIIETSAGKLSDILLKKLTDEEAAEALETIRENREIQENNELSRHLREEGDGRMSPLFQFKPKKRRPFRFASIPAYTAKQEGKKSGIVRRQCTREFKIEAVEETIKRVVVGLKFKQRFPDDIRVRQYFGLSFDEGKRVATVRKRFQDINWSTPHFPLWDTQLNRQDVISILGQLDIPHEVPRSACVFCPFRRNVEWRRLRDTDPEGWKEAVRVDRALREPNVIANVGMEQALYLHESCVPLGIAPIDKPDSATKRAAEVLETECEGACGN